MVRLLFQKSLRPAKRRFTSIFCVPLAISLLAGCANYHAPAPAALPAIALSASSFDFKTVVVGQTLTHTLHLSNTGTAPLSITGLALSDKQFVISGPSVPRVVLPNMGLDYSLSFTPSAAGSASASLQIASNASNPVVSVSLSGIGQKVVSAVQVSPPAVNFGTLTLQSTATKSITLQNSGDVNITLSGITVAGSGFGYSNLSPGYQLPPNASVTFQVWFRPTTSGPASGTVSILSANLSSPANLSLAGDGVTASTNPPPTPTPKPVQHTVHLSWNLSNSAVSGYRVYRSLSGSGGFQLITASLVAAATYDDDTVVSGDTYVYEVTAVDSTGAESSDSNQATAVIPTP